MLSEAPLRGTRGTLGVLVAAVQCTRAPKLWWQVTRLDHTHTGVHYCNAHSLEDNFVTERSEPGPSCPARAAAFAVQCPCAEPSDSEGPADAGTSLGVLLLPALACRCPKPAASGDTLAASGAVPLSISACIRSRSASLSSRRKFVARMDSSVPPRHLTSQRPVPVKNLKASATCPLYCGVFSRP